MKLRSVQRLVDRLLDNMPETRSNDRLLIEQFFLQNYNITTFAQYNSQICPTIESVRRVRQKLQAKGLYRPVEAVAIARDEVMEDFFDYAISA